MKKFYVICDGEAIFFSSSQEAEDFQEEEYYRCTGDVRPVPEDATHYCLKDSKGVLYCLFFTDAEAENVNSPKKIEVKP